VLLLSSLAAEHWLGPKYFWIPWARNVLTCIISIDYFFGSNNASTVAKQQTPRETLGTIGFVTAFLGIGIYFNRGSWFLAILIPIFLCFLISLAVLIRREAENIENVSPSSKTIQ